MRNQGSSQADIDEPLEPPSSGAADLEPHGLARNSVYSPTGLYGPTQQYPFTDALIYSGRSVAFRHTYFPQATAEDWNDWRWQLRNRINDIDRLSAVVNLTDDERKAVGDGARGLSFGVTPYYLSLIDPDDSSQPLRRCMIPVTAESICGPGEAADPLGEEADSPVHGLVHRYPDRVLLLVTGFCSSYCRYCTRSRMVGHTGPTRLRGDQLEQAISYIEDHPQIRDVLISGGDPLTMPDADLDRILGRLRRIKHVEILRIGTKAPVVLPQRITRRLTKILSRHHPLFMSIHFTHPAELTGEVYEACTRLADAGIPLGSQTVLLSGINDEVATMKRLVQGLLRMRVRPYYLYQCDPITGSAHFRTPVSKGLEIIQGLRGHTTGYAIPNYVIDAPGGGGKIPLQPEYVVGREGKNLILQNYEGKQFVYPDILGETIN